MRPVRTVLLALAAFALPPATGAGATSIGTAPPHDPGRGCHAIKSVIKNLNAGRLRERGSPFPWYYDDAFGEVEDREAAAFLHALRHSEGKPDAKPIELYRVYNLHRDSHQPIYLVVLARSAWHETRLEQDDMLMWNEVAAPHYGFDTSYWLVKFQSNDVRSFREVPELYAIGDEASELKGCHQD